MRRFTRVLPVVLIGLLGVFAAPAVTSAAAVTRYVDCSAGRDTNTGGSPTAAWKTIGRVNGASLAPGSKLFFKRGCTWTGTAVQAKWNGTSTAPITIGAYGTGSKPLFQNAQDQFYIRGSYLVIENLAARADPVTYDTQCQNAPAGRRTGFRLASGAHHNTLRYLKADGLFIGIWSDNYSHHNTITANTLTNNRMKSDIWSSDAGAVGISLHGDDNDVSYNTISGSDTCSRFYGRDGSAVEVYGGQRNRIHHNRAINNNNFTELGNPRSADNTYAYNVVTATLAAGHFLTTRGGGDTKYGPIYRTKAYNNTVYLSGPNSYAVQCTKGCGPSILSLRNNIIFANYSVGYADAAFDEGDNVFWKAGGNPSVWFPMSASSVKADPRWANPGAGDFKLLTGSPALNQAGNQAPNMGYRKDYVGTAVPQAAVVDVGALERVP